jgi:hypothetical protein
VITARKSRKNEKSSSFWYIWLCNPLKVNHPFGGTCHLHLRGRRINKKTSMTCYKTYVDFQRTTRRYSPEDITLHSENLKSYINANKLFSYFLRVNRTNWRHQSMTEDIYYSNAVLTFSFCWTIHFFCPLHEVHKMNAMNKWRLCMSVLHFLFWHPKLFGGSSTVAV